MPRTLRRRSLQVRYSNNNLYPNRLQLTRHEACREPSRHLVLETAEFAVISGRALQEQVLFVAALSKGASSLHNGHIFVQAKSVALGHTM